MDTSTGRQWSVFYAYTAWSILVVLMMLPLGVGVFLEFGLRQQFSGHPALSALLLVQIAVGAWSGWRTMRAWSTEGVSSSRDRWDLPRVGVLPSDLSLLLTAVPTLVIGAAVAGGAEPRMLLVSMSLLVALVTMRWRWELGLAGSLLVGVLIVLLGGSPGTASTCAALIFAAVLMVRLSLWLAAMVRELDVAREAQAALAVAEERLRFARDLHDLTGRDLSVIAVKSELVAQLAERQDPRAVEHGREVAQIARTSLAEIRGLVRGYREADLATELRGTASLLRSAQAVVTIHGSAADVPARHAGTAAWVLREAGTNILRHADPSVVTITLGRDAITLVNDGAPGQGEVPEGSGLTGMRERLGDTSALSVHRDAGLFTLDVRFDPPGDPR